MGFVHSVDILATVTGEEVSYDFGTQPNGTAARERAADALIQSRIAFGQVGTAIVTRGEGIGSPAEDALLVGAAGFLGKYGLREVHVEYGIPAEVIL